MAGLEVIKWRMADWKALPLAGGGVAFWWLGQAGFAVRCGGLSFLIDPYLSDSLARKYAGKKYPHIRMMPPPIVPDAVADVDFVFCTHRHTDHMDPETLGRIAKCGKARFVVPRAIRGHAVEKAGLDPDRLVCVNAGEELELVPGLAVRPVPAAHETLEQNEKGEFVALGYVIRLGGFRVYHAGDCLPYDGLGRLLAEAGPIDLALLPVNGRDPERTAAGVPGNFTIDEALALFAEVPFGRMIVGHFGMFDFNTVDPALIRRRIGEAGLAEQVVVPEVDVAYRWS